MKKFLYLEKYNLLTKQTKYSCSIFLRSEAEKMIRETHLSSQLTYVLHLQDWTCRERTATEKRQKNCGEMLCKGGTCTSGDWGIQGDEYVLWWYRKMLPTLWCSLWHGLIWSLVCTAPLCQQGPWVPSTSLTGPCFLAEEDPLSGHRDHIATYSKMSMQALGWRTKGTEQVLKHLQSRDMIDYLSKYTEVASYEVLQHSDRKSQLRY